MVNVDSLNSTYLVIHFMMSYDDSTYLVIEIMTYDVSIKMKAKMCESLKKIVHCQYKSMNYHRNWILTGEIIRPIQLLKTKFHVAFLCIYDVIRLHQVSGSSNYDDVMTKQVPGVSGANLVGRHLPSVPYHVCSWNFISKLFVSFLKCMQAL